MSLELLLTFPTKVGNISRAKLRKRNGKSLVPYILIGKTDTAGVNNGILN